MQRSQPYFFASYAHQDREKVYQITDRLAAADIQIWSDRKLHPGDNWQEAIANTISGATGMLLFLSEASIGSKWITQQFTTFATEKKLPIIPILLEKVPNLPSELLRYQFVDLSDPVSYETGIQRLINRLKHWEDASSSISKDSVEELARGAVHEAAAARKDVAREQKSTPHSIFIVHGHDIEFLEEVKIFLTENNIVPIILKDEENQHISLFEKFWKYSESVQFAIILISSDDLGASLREYQAIYEDEQVKTKSLKYRARQNVILEMGFFYGRLGTEHVFVLMKSPPAYYPTFERPSDVDGVLFEEFDHTGMWKEKLKHNLRDVGFKI